MIHRCYYKSVSISLSFHLYKISIFFNYFLLYDSHYKRPILFIIRHFSQFIARFCFVFRVNSSFINYYFCKVYFILIFMQTFLCLIFLFINAMVKVFQLYYLFIRVGKMFFPFLNFFLL